MGDIGNILWIVVAVGIMVANYLSKAQKEAHGKESAHPGNAEEAGEAWPSMEAPQQERGSHQERRLQQERGPYANQPHAAGSPRHEVQGRTPASSRQPGGWPAIPGFPGQPDESGRPTVEPAQQVQRRIRMADPAPEADFPHGNQAEGRVSRQAPQHRTDTQNASKKANTELAKGQFTDEQPDGENMPGEEFDLRRAVIYSEILKPKFEE